MLSELPESVIQEVVAYTWNQYLADIGGATSLILGISAVTILTFIENCLKRSSLVSHAPTLKPNYIRIYKIIAGLAIFSQPGDLRDKQTEARLSIAKIETLIDFAYQNRLPMKGAEPIWNSVRVFV